MNITLLTIGKSKLKESDIWSAEYIKRLSWKITLVEIPESKAQTSSLRKKEEAKKLGEHLTKFDAIVLLDEHGKQKTSKEFAHFFRELANNGKSKIAIIIGGADGLHDDIIEKSNYQISLGKMTWPHIMVRLMLLEQIYRAYSILNNHPYHRE